MNSFVRLQDSVGSALDYRHGDGALRHGTVVKANYSTLGELVLVIHPTVRPCEMAADDVLIGPAADDALATLRGPAPDPSPRLVDQSSGGLDQPCRHTLGSQPDGLPCTLGSHDGRTGHVFRDPYGSDLDDRHRDGGHG